MFISSRSLLMTKAKEVYIGHKEQRHIENRPKWIDLSIILHLFNEKCKKTLKDWVIGKENLCVIQITHITLVDYILVQKYVCDVFSLNSELFTST